MLCNYILRESYYGCRIARCAALVSVNSIVSKDHIIRVFIRLYQTASTVRRLMMN